MSGQETRHGRDTLLIFARLPRPGEVKTRLAKAIGDECASEIFRICAEHLFQEALKLQKIDVYMFYADQDDAEGIKQWVPEQFAVLQQAGSDLGERMKNAFSYAFEHGASRCIIVGTDVPDVSAELLRHAFQALREHDIVLGPSYDGGYYLLGMCALCEDLFKDVPWSTEHVLPITRTVIERFGLTHHILPTLIDVDTEDDLLQWVSVPTTDRNHPLFAPANLVRTEARG